MLTLREYKINYFFCMQKVKFQTAVFQELIKSILRNLMCVGFVYNSKSVSHNLDIESPVISGCPSTQSGVIDSDMGEAIISWTVPTAADNSGMQTLSASHNPGDSFSSGSTTVSYTSIDGAGNTATCSFDVVVVIGEFLDLLVVNLCILLNENDCS